MSAQSSRRGTPATTFLLIAIVIGFGIEIVTGAWLDGRKLAELGAVVPEYIRYEHEYWRLLTAMFLHGDGTVPGDALHLAMNLFALFQIGSLFEVIFGSRRFLFIYFVTGIIASITSATLNEGASVGASGAIFGIIGAFIISVWRSPRLKKERIARSIVNQLIFWVVANTIIALRVPQIDMAAHMGGFIAGAILAWILPRHAPPPPRPAEVVVDVMPYEE
jgi:rhomboid protease GluP